MDSPNSFITEGYNLQLGIRQAASETSNNEAQNKYSSVIIFQGKCEVFQ